MRYNYRKKYISVMPKNIELINEAGVNSLSMFTNVVNNESLDYKNDI